jgi:hypothetical protein
MRVGAAIGLVALVPVAVFLLLSDRAPLIVEDGLETARARGRSAEHRLGLHFDLPSLPYHWEQVGHATLWGIVAALGGILVYRLVSLVAVGITVYAVSALAEVAQMLFSVTRDAQAGDLAANAVGITAGLLVVWATGRLVVARQRA